LRILHVSHQQFKYLGARNYLFPVRINNGFIRNGHEVYWFSDRDVARCSSLLGVRAMGVGAANRKFIEVCRNFEPDVIAFCTADLITAETIAEARRLLPNAVVFQYYIDPLFLESNYRNARSKADVVDMTFVTTGGPVLSKVAGSRSRAAYIPNPVDSSIDVHRCHELANLELDVFFSGAIPDSNQPDDLRSRAYGLIRERIPEARCGFYGRGLANGPLWGAAFMRELGRSKIGLNFSLRVTDTPPGPGRELYLYSSDRIGLYQGNGLLVFVPKIFNLSDLYGADTIVEVGGVDDFIDKLGFYLRNDDERRQIARRGYELAHAEFNERLVAQYMIEATLAMPFSHAYRWPVDSYGR
jgi:hypothetical protein